jgi:hypothetical protein
LELQESAGSFLSVFSPAKAVSGRFSDDRKKMLPLDSKSGYKYFQLTCCPVNNLSEKAIHDRHLKRDNP